MNLAWMNNGFICKDLYAPFVLDKDTDYLDDLKKKYKTVADVQGNWKVTLPILKAGGPYTMAINDIELKDILIGDVWVCSGQSNMELPVSRVTDRFRDEISTDSNYPMVRYIKTPLLYNFHAPQADIPGISWQAMTPENVMPFSALAYFFAKDVYQKTKVPVGIINSSVGGSPVEAWISEEGLKPFPYYLNEKDLYKNFMETSFQMTHNISASGGTDKLRYRISGGYNSNDGVLISDRDKFERMNVNSFISADVTKWFTSQ